MVGRKLSPHYNKGNRFTRLIEEKVMHDEFLRVVLDDPFYKGRKCVGLVRLSDGVQAVPAYAEKGPDGKFWRATSDHPGAKAVSLLVITRFGTFSTGHWASMVNLIGKENVEEIFETKLQSEPFGFAKAISDKELPPEKK